MNANDKQGLWHPHGVDTPRLSVFSDVCGPTGSVLFGLAIRWSEMRRFELHLCFFVHLLVQEAGAATCRAHFDKRRNPSRMCTPSLIHSSLTMNTTLVAYAPSGYLPARYRASSAQSIATGRPHLAILPVVPDSPPALPRAAGVLLVVALLFERFVADGLVISELVGLGLCVSVSIDTGCTGPPPSSSPDQ